jgi:hypothetical protein
VIGWRSRSRGVIIARVKRLYRLQSADFVTGTCADGRQAVMGLLCPNLVTFFFTASGAPGDKRRDACDPAPPQNGGAYQIYDRAFVAGFKKQLAAWQKRLGFVEGPVLLESFFDDESYVGIVDLPDHLEDMGWATNLDERRALEAERQRWIERGAFVFYWAKDYWMSREGEVEST